ncbi:MAG: GTPase [Verrucomicrobiota bacterium]
MKRSNTNSHEELKNALHDCRVIAHAEYEIAESAGIRVDSVCGRLIQALREKSAAFDGHRAGQGQLQASVSRICAQLETEVLPLMADARRRLDSQRRQLGHFTIGLFGRSMVGKSTLRETITHGDGATIGKGAQNTTRDLWSYKWEGMTIIDTPGFGVWDGDKFKRKARQVIEQSDLILFMCSSNGTLEEDMEMMGELALENKPALFVLNVRNNLEDAFQRRRFLKAPERTMGLEIIGGHFTRIRTLAKMLGRPQPTIIPIHAQAAFFATREEHKQDAEALHRASNLDTLHDAIVGEVIGFGGCRRVMTLLDGMGAACEKIEAQLGRCSADLGEAARFLHNQADEFQKKSETFCADKEADIEARTNKAFALLRRKVAGFVEDNIEHHDAGERWQRTAKDCGVEQRITEIGEMLKSETENFVKAFETDFHEDAQFAAAFSMDNPTRASVADAKKIWGWVSAAAGGVAAVAFAIGETNFWNPAGWVAFGVGIVAGIISWFSGSRAAKIARAKADACQQLHRNIDESEKKCRAEVAVWFEKYARKLFENILTDLRRAQHDIDSLRRRLTTDRSKLARAVGKLNTRLLRRLSELRSAAIPDGEIQSLVRRRGHALKCLLASRATAARVEKQVSPILGEHVVGVLATASLTARIVSALRPARLTPRDVTLKNRKAVVHARGNTLSMLKSKVSFHTELASKLLGVAITVHAIKETKSNATRKRR